MAYNLHAACCKALQLEFDEERIREVPVPDGDDPADWAGEAWKR